MPRKVDRHVMSLTRMPPLDDARRFPGLVAHDPGSLYRAAAALSCASRPRRAPVPTTLTTAQGATAQRVVSENVGGAKRRGVVVL